MIMQDTQAFLQRYTQEFSQALQGIEADVNGVSSPFAAGLDHVRRWLLDLQAQQRKMMIIGNGGSAGVASHMAIDFWKNGQIRCLTFNDGALLTCLSNDYSYEEAFAYAVDQFGDPGDLLIAISSSGSSQNILNASQVALTKGITLVTCSGFQPDNPLRQLGQANFFVPSFSYGFVETLHQFIIHTMLDVKLYCDDQLDIFHRNWPLNPEADPR
jgi:D-sedoheptulose 7-phosphate isomerase